MGPMPATRVRVELDHVIVMCAVGAPEADVLVRAGVREGTGNTHPGQGTACRRFFFAQQYIELVWVHDAEEAQRPVVRDTGLWARWSARQQGACPFGIVLRPVAGTQIEAPFPTWPYKPSYLPQDMVIEVAQDTPLTEPAFFFLGFVRGRAGQQPREHGITASVFTGLRLGSPVSTLRSPAGQWATASGLLSTEASDDYEMHLIFDHEATGRCLDLRPILPLVLKW